MTPRQERFVLEYLMDLNATQAAVRAGYSARTARAQGARLLTCPRVEQAVQEGRRKTAERLEISREDLIRETEKVYKRAAADRDKLAALRLIGDLTGMFEHKVRAVGQVRQVVIHESAEPPGV